MTPGAPSAAGMRLVPDRTEGIGLEGLTSEYQQLMKIVADGAVMARDVARALGRELTPGKVEPVRSQLRKLADLGWLTKNGSDLLGQAPAPARSPPPATTRSPEVSGRPASEPWPTSAPPPICGPVRQVRVG